MEKVTFPPLIELLQENAEALNQILRSSRAVSRNLSTVDIPAWFVSVIEPVFKAVYAHDQTRSRKLFDALYRDMLRVLSNPAASADSELLKASRLLIGLNPAVTAVSPAKTLAYMNTALQRINRHSSQAARAWIALMQQIVPLVKDMKELLAAGRIAAWRCGMAHLRSHTDVSAVVDKQIISIIFAGETGEPGVLRRRWDSEKTAASTAAGSFSGFGGTFARPPCLMLKGDIVFVSDKSRTSALFADRFGYVLQDCPEAFADSLTFALRPARSAPTEVARILARYSDLTSWVYHDATLYLTIRSAHAVFVFGGIDG